MSGLEMIRTTELFNDAKKRAECDDVAAAILVLARELRESHDELTEKLTHEICVLGRIIKNENEEGD